MKNNRSIFILVGILTLLVVGVISIIAKGTAQQEEVFIRLNYLVGSEHVSDLAKSEAQRFLSDEVLDWAAKKLQEHGARYNSNELREMIKVNIVPELPAVITIDLKTPYRSNIYTIRQVLVESFRLNVMQNLYMKLQRSNVFYKKEMAKLIEQKQQIETDGIDASESNKLAAIKEEMRLLFNEARASIKGFEDGQVIDVIRVTSKERREKAEKDAGIDEAP